MIQSTDYVLRAPGAPVFVLVPARVAAVIDRRLGDLHVELRGLDAEVSAVLMALRDLAALHRARTELPAAEAADASAASEAASSEWVDANTAAKVVGVSPRAVRDAAARGRVTATRSAAGWQLDLDDIERWAAERAG